MKTLKMLMFPVVLLTLSLSLSACGNTWEGLKKDTGQNMEKTGDAIEDAGEKVKD